MIPVKLADNLYGVRYVGNAYTVYFPSDGSPVIIVNITEMVNVDPGDWRYDFLLEEINIYKEQYE